MTFLVGATLLGFGIIFVLGLVVVRRLSLERSSRGCCRGGFLQPVRHKTLGLIIFDISGSGTAVLADLDLGVEVLVLVLDVAHIPGHGVPGDLEEKK